MVYLFSILLTQARLTPKCLASSALVQLFFFINFVYRFFLSAFDSLVFIDGGCLVSFPK